MPKTILLISLLLASSTISACARFGSFGAAPAASPTATLASGPVATPILALATPLPVGTEMPLQAAEVMAPETWIVPALQPKQALAVYLKTTVEQLDWVNPGLTDPVAPGTLIAIPPSYRVSSGESLSSIATNTGLPADILQAANPKLSATGDLSPGTVLAVPPIIVMQEAVSLEAAAASLDASGDALLSANPDLANSSAIQAGTVLVLPPESETETSPP